MIELIPSIKAVFDMAAKIYQIYKERKNSTNGDPELPKYEESETKEARDNAHNYMKNFEAFCLQQNEIVERAAKESKDKTEFEAIQAKAIESIADRTVEYVNLAMADDLDFKSRLADFLLKLTIMHPNDDISREINKFLQDEMSKK